MKRMIGILLVVVMMFVQFGGVTARGAEGAWYLISQELEKGDYDGKEVPTSGLSGYVDYGKIEYEKLEGSHNVTLIGRRTHVDSGNNAIYTVDSIQWTDPEYSYTVGQQATINLTRTTLQDTNYNQYDSFVSGYYTKSTDDFYKWDVKLRNAYGQHYVNDTTYGPSHTLVLEEGFQEGSVGGVDRFDLYVAMRASSPYTYVYHYEWRISDPNAGDLLITTAGDSPLTIDFYDLPQSHWSYTYVQHMVGLGIIDGYEDGSFRPNADFSRAAFAKLLALTFQLETYKGSEAAYSDLPTSHWAYNYVMTANEFLTSYETGGAKYFIPDDAAEREDVAVAMIKAMGLDKDDADLTYLDSYTDKNQISENLRQYIALAVEYGVMDGTGNNEFSPRDPLTRAQACTLFARYLIEIKDTLDAGSMEKVVN